MEQSRLTYLFNLYYAKTASEIERAEFLSYVSKSENDEQLKALLTKKWLEDENEAEVLNSQQVEETLSAIIQKAKADDQFSSTVKPGAYRKFYRIAGAATIILVAGLSVYSFLRIKPASVEMAQNKRVAPKPKISIGSEKAILTIGDGSQIKLDNKHQGVLLKQGNTTVINEKAGTIAYNTEKNSNKKVVYNMLSTPKGGKYQLILPDQTKVWLNSSSSISFPTQFNANERIVTITGEVYFEVAKHDVTASSWPASSSSLPEGARQKTKRLPFIVKSNGQQLEVLGTHFNINSYADEAVTATTLLEGSVKIVSKTLHARNNEHVVLKPGQESSLGKTGQIKVRQADIDEVMAWKNGWFNFNEYDIQKVMRQISRWYDVEVIYQGEIPAGHFSGAVSQSNDISTVLTILEAGGVNFRTDGRKIIVLP